VQAALHAAQTRLHNVIAHRIVYGEWRTLLVHKLWVPSPTAPESTLFHESAVTVLEQQMDDLYDFLLPYFVRVRLIIVWCFFSSWLQVLTFERESGRVCGEHHMERVDELSTMGSLVRSGPALVLSC
jgi:hypothetical protein